MNQEQIKILIATQERLKNEINRYVKLSALFAVILVLDIVLNFFGFRILFYFDILVFVIIISVVSIMIKMNDSKLTDIELRLSEAPKSSLAKVKKEYEEESKKNGTCPKILKCKKCGNVQKFSMSGHCDKCDGTLTVASKK